MEVAQEVACQPVRNEADFHHNSGRRLIRISLQHQSQPPETLRKQLLCLLSIAHAPLAPFSIGLKPRPLCVLRGGLGAESSRDRSLPQSSPAHRRKRGRKAWRRRRKRRERRRWWWRPLASVRWRRRWWRQWTGRLGVEESEQPLAEGWPKTGSRLLSLAGSRACNCPSRTPPPWPTRSVSRSGLACPPLPWPTPLQDRFDSFPKLPGLRASSPDLSHRREDWLPFPQVSPRVDLRSLPCNLQGRLASSGDPFVCAFLPFRLGDAASPAFPRHLRTTAQCAPSPIPSSRAQHLVRKAEVQDYPAVSCCCLFLYLL